MAVIVEDWLWGKNFGRKVDDAYGWWRQKGGEGFSHGPELYPAEQSSEEMYSPDIENIERLLDWLEEIWLDERVQETIDEDSLMRIIESLKELL